MRIKKELGLLVGFQTPPHRDLRRYDRLRALGLNRVSFCFEIFDRERFREICPGKHAEYGLDYYLEAVRYCAALGEDGAAPRAVGHERRDHRRARAAGVVDPRDRLDHVGRRRSRPSASSVRWSAPTCEHEAPPRTAEMVPVFRRLYEAVHGARPADRRARPNVHVSLVMLPEECRALSPRRFPFRSVKLAAMGAAFGYQFRRRTARAASARVLQPAT